MAQNLCSHGHRADTGQMWLVKSYMWYQRQVSTGVKAKLTNIFNRHLTIVLTLALTITILMLLSLPY